jgi:hypothetical protein
MVNNSTKIIITSNHLSAKIIKQTKNKQNKNITYDDRNPGPGVGQAQKYGTVKHFIALLHFSHCRGFNDDHNYYVLLSGGLLSCSPFTSIYMYFLKIVDIYTYIL